MNGVSDRLGFSLYSNCTNDAVMDAKTGKMLFQHPQPGSRGTAGRNTIELPGTWRFDANMSKTFRVTESKNVQIRFDATNILNHPNMGTPTVDTNSNTPFGVITAKGTDTRQFQGQLRLTF